MPSLTSIKTSGNDIEIVNQLLLPHTTEWLKIDSVEDAHEAIKSMKIRGAPAIASLASLSVAQALTRFLEQPGSEANAIILASTDSLRAWLFPALDFLFTARPTAVNLGTAITRLRTKFNSLVATHASTSSSVSVIVQELILEAKAVADEDVGRNKLMSKHGAEWLLDEVKKLGKPLIDGERVNVLTVCNTGSLATSGYGTALGVITHLFETNKLGKAYYTQTAPYHQGSRLTSLELITLGVPSVMICDTMVGSLFQHYNIHAVIVGADRIAKNGDTANKIGTYNAAVLAARHNIAFIVAAPISTVDLNTPSGDQIPIEQRPTIEACLVRGAVYPDTSSSKRQEVVMITPPNIDLQNGVYNPSFDVTPAELITAIVTEKGVAVKKEGENAFDLTNVV